MLEVYHTASRLIKMHDELATQVAGERASELRDAGEELQCRRWKEVMIATKLLLARHYAE